MNNIRKIALEYLLEQEQISKLPITFDDLMYIIEKHKWAVFAYSDFVPYIDTSTEDGKKLMQHIGANKGLVIDDSGTPTIIFDDRLPHIEKIYTVAHEIGHIKLKHKTFSLTGDNITDAEKETQEHEAEVFATEFLAPQPILRKMEISSIDDMYNLDLLPDHQAEKQFCSITKYSAAFLNSNTISKRVINKFKKYINQSAKKLHKETRRKQAVKALIYFIALCITISVLITQKPADNNTDIHTSEANEQFKSTQEPKPTSERQNSKDLNSNKNNTTTNKEVKSKTVLTQPTAQPTYTPAPTSFPTKAPYPETKVYVVAGGNEYHNSWCERITNEYAIMALTLQEAQAYGYSPCPVCCN